jgi:DASS family divalent anion:Na+ symporter
MKSSWFRWIVVLVPGLFIYLAPLPSVTVPQRHLVGIFIATIISLVARPVAMGVSVLLAMTLLVLTNTLPATKVLSGFGNATVWLVFSAFLFSKAVTASGFGLRVAYMFIRRFGRNSLTLAYSLAASDVVLAPFVPSDTARGGGIMFPITRSLAQAFQSEPGPTAGKLGSFLVLVGFHSTYTASAMFLTGMAANPLIADFAQKIAGVHLTWMRWAIAASVPGLLTLFFMPQVIYRLNPPEIKNTEFARELAGNELRKMGAMRRSEWILVIVMLAVMAGWVTSDWHGIPNAFVALAGISAILICGVLTWDDLLGEKRAWDALIWFAPMLMMADAMNENGVIGILSKDVFGSIGGWHWVPALIVLVMLYLYSHYAFASMTAHVTALYPGFAAAALAAGVPPLLAALPLAYFSNLNAGLTHYGTGSAPVFFGSGYVDQGTWWKLGFVLSVMNLLFWLGVGLLWWKVLGLW